MKKEFLLLIIKRIASSVVILFLMISLLFFLLRAAPGDPSQKFASPEFSPELAERVKESFNLNSSVFDQYAVFLVNAAKGDFGISYTYRMPVLSVIKEYLPFTIIFSLISFILQISAALLISLAAVKNKNGFTDKAFSKISLVIYALPSFVIGVGLIFLFSEIMKLFPSSGLRSFDHDSLPFIQKFFDYLRHLTLPLITLSLGGAAIFFRYLRDNLEEIFNRTYILNLRANGFPEKEIITMHIIPNAAGPLISIAGVELGLLLSGALITEVIFGLPGMGRLTVTAISLRDYPLIIGCTFAAGFLVLISNLMADILKAKIDKRLIKGI